VVGAHPSLAGHPSSAVCGVCPRAHSRTGPAIASLIVGQATMEGVLRAAPLIVPRGLRRDRRAQRARDCLARSLDDRSSGAVGTSFLVGPANPFLARSSGRRAAQGIIMVAASAMTAHPPPVCPASYPYVIAVTGGDARNHVLIEAGRALHLDYARPARDMTRRAAVRRDYPSAGTSMPARSWPRVSRGLYRVAVPLPTTGARGAFSPIASDRSLATRADDLWTRPDFCGRIALAP